jgi:hypothetical protein
MAQVSLIRYTWEKAEKKSLLLEFYLVVQARIAILAQCSCFLRRSIPDLYFCESCAHLACDECTSVEIGIL